MVQQRTGTPSFRGESGVRIRGTASMLDRTGRGVAVYRDMGWVYDISDVYRRVFLSPAGSSGANATGSRTDPGSARLGEDRSYGSHVSRTGYAK
ncbi:hypothetical protein MHYP_G00053240 [Metynnis hypsauchen]